MWAVVGLGNPGKDYAKTRHNVGILLINQLKSRWDVRLKGMGRRFRGAKARIGKNEILLARSKDFMNRSGYAVKKIKDKYQIPLEKLIIAHDDFDLSLGEIRIKRGGSGGSHKGVRSVIENLGTQEFPRIKIGIGPVPQEQDPSLFVLSPFEEQEWPLLDESIQMSAKALDMILARSFDEAMNVYNRKRSDI
ncbi:MAG: aminoacyl-tRNA hydrolase [Candidatus Aminicenantes bacterium]|nr:aminoacyl-tRNA hydrolase [Candidatus Aminicenantes bacterium]